MKDYKAQVNDFALTKALEVVVVLDIKDNIAHCRYSYDYDEKKTIYLPKDDLIKFTHKSAELATKKLGKKIGELNYRQHEIDDCVNYLD